MKKAILSLLAAVLLLPALAFAEGVFAFEEASYALIPKKSLVLEPVAQGIDEKLSYTWSSSDEKVAKVSQKGKVTGVSKGTAEITCTGKDKEGREYTAICEVAVKPAVEKIVPLDKSLVLPCGTCFAPGDLFRVEPEEVLQDGFDFVLEITNYVVTHPFNDGTLLAFSPGKSDITLKSQDGSGKKGTIKVTVPQVFLWEDEVVISEPQGYILCYQENTGGYIYITSSKGIFRLENPTEEEVQAAKEKWGITDNIELSTDFKKLMPQKAGSEVVKYRSEGKAKKLKITVEHSAVIDDVSYPRHTPSDLLDSPSGEKVSIEGEVYKKDEGIIYAKSKGDLYAFTTPKADRLIPGETYIVYGSVVDCIEYSTETGLKYKCPVIQAEAIR